MRRIIDSLLRWAYAQFEILWEWFWNLRLLQSPQGVISAFYIGFGFALTHLHSNSPDAFGLNFVEEYFGIPPMLVAVTFGVCGWILAFYSRELSMRVYVLMLVPLMIYSVSLLLVADFEQTPLYILPVMYLIFAIALAVVNLRQWSEIQELRRQARELREGTKQIAEYIGMDTNNLSTMRREHQRNRDKRSVHKDTESVLN